MRKTFLPLAVLVLLGCTESGRPRNALAPGTYQLAYAAEGETGTAVVTGLDLTVPLPAGVTVATAQGGSGPILGASLSTGAALKDATTLIVGQFSQESCQARLTLITAAPAAWKGEFARLTFTVPVGAAVSEPALLALIRAPLPRYQVTGLAGANHDAVTLTAAVRTTVTLIKH